MAVGFFAAGGQTNGFSQFKVIQSVCQCLDIVVLLVLDREDPIPHAKLSGTNLNIGTCL